MLRSLSILSLALLSIQLCSCASTHSADIKRSVCRMLKSDIVFNGATGDTRRAEIENSEKDLQQHTYRCVCDQM